MIEKHDVPLDPPLAHELVDFWTYIWNEPPDVPIDVFLGSESEHNDLSVFFERGSVGVTSTCMIVAPRAMADDLGPRRGRDASRPPATAACRRGSAARRSTWPSKTAARRCSSAPAGAPPPGSTRGSASGKLPGASWWINVANGEPPEAFVVDYFRRPAASVTVRPASPADRLPMIPLIVSPHRWRRPRRQRRDLLDRLRQRRLLHPLHALHQDRDRRGRLLVHRRHRRRARRRSGHRAPGRPRRVAGGRLHAVSVHRRLAEPDRGGSRRRRRRAAPGAAAST